MTRKIGKVFLIGAGPGDPGLLTVKAKHCIETADVVVYDPDTIRRAPNWNELVRLRDQPAGEWRWAQRAEPLHPSPLGVLIHPVHGLWHAYRGALAFAEPIELPPRADLPSPCASCRSAGG